MNPQIKFSKDLSCIVIIVVEIATGSCPLAVKWSSKC